MSKTQTPVDYHSALTMYQTQLAIGFLKRDFENNLSSSLDLTRVSAPLILDPSTGLNDDLNGIERAVEFDIRETGANAQIVHSLAKWKRYALGKYGFPLGTGLYTDMNAIRRDEDMDNLHSIYVDQWDWERIMDKDTRTKETLIEVVQAIVNAICDTKDALNTAYPALSSTLSKEISFVTTQELEDLYPTLQPKEREEKYIEKHKTAFIMEIGDLLASGVRHDGRAPDYDDWTLNGDIVFWSEVLQCAFEVSSMGIRVDETAMESQLTKSGFVQRSFLPFHKLLLEGRLPQTIGGGIGQSRLCMLLLEKAHIGEVQVSVWDTDTLATCRKAGIMLL
jgi:aspartate--ammonia ligase